MPVRMVCGLQWGDEAKGKITHLLADDADYVARFAGGPNSGHTIVTGGKTVKLHVVPAGIMKKGVINLMGSGMVIDPVGLVDELKDVASVADFDGRLFISDGAHMIFEYHRYQEELDEKARGMGSIGTSMRGIGPCYADKINRIGIRTGLLRDENRLKRILSRNLKQKNRVFESLYNSKPLTFDEVYDPIIKTISTISPMLANTSKIAHDALSKDRSVLLEGNQGILLDLEHGTYPYVTSSSCLPASGMSTFGLSPTHLKRVTGVVKAYQTRVGKGPFPTKLNDEVGQTIRERGNEYGTTTGRPRDCGWLDLVALKYAVRISGATDLALTLVDVFDTFKEIRACTAYMLDGRTIDEFDPDSGILERVAPIYKRFDGWMADITDIQWIDELPTEAKEYVKFIEDYVGIPVNIVSVGPGEKQTARRRP